MINWNGLVSLLLACLEFILLINLLVFAQKNKTNIAAFILITLLAVYQMLEFLMCTLDLKYSCMAYLAFADISFIPPLNLIFILKLFKLDRKYFKLIYLPAIAFIIYYFFEVNKFAVVSCSVLYAAYTYPLGTLYAFFFYTPILGAIILLIWKIKCIEDALKKKSAGYLLNSLLFISIPVISAFALLILHKDFLLNMIESVMCKFAFVYAVSLAYFSLTNKKTANE